MHTCREEEGEQRDITRDEDTGVFLRRWGAAGLLAVPPAHLPGQRAKSVTGQTPHPAETAPAKQAQHGRSGLADRRTRFHVLWQAFGELNWDLKRPYWWHRTSATWWRRHVEVRLKITQRGYRISLGGLFCFCFVFFLPVCWQKQKSQSGDFWSSWCNSTKPHLKVLLLSKFKTRAYKTASEALKN